MITASLLRRRSRMLIALLSIGIGATILAGLVTIYVDVPRQMGAQFRSYGANMLLLPVDGETLDSESLAEAVQVIPADALVGAAPISAWKARTPAKPVRFWWAGKSPKRSA